MGSLRIESSQSLLNPFFFRYPLLWSGHTEYIPTKTWLSRHYQPKDSLLLLNTLSTAFLFQDRNWKHWGSTLSKTLSKFLRLNNCFHRGPPF